MTKPSPYEKITTRLVEMMEAGVRPWNPGYRRRGDSVAHYRPTRACGERYRGINVLILWSAAEERGFSSGRWMTYKQAQKLGGQVRKGEKGEQIVFYKTLSVEKEMDVVGADGRLTGQSETVDLKIPMLRLYTVFNVAQIDGLPACEAEREDPLPESDRHADAEAWMAGTRARIDHQAGVIPHYSPLQDHVVLPPFADYREAGRYYSTAAHELVHWTGSEKRLSRFATPGLKHSERAFEELIAEIGAAFVCADLGLESEPREDHAAYLASWIKALKGDPKFIFKAAAAAEKACGYLHDLQPSLEQFAIAAE